MIHLQKHINMLGLRAEDKITGFVGTVASVCFDLYGCVQVAITPACKEGTLGESKWFDIGRVTVVDTTPVMQRPEFEWAPENIAKGEKGPSEKPALHRECPTGHGR